MDEDEFNEAWVEEEEIDDYYCISINDPVANAARNYPNNYIRTAKYTILTFIPINLFEQFRRFANFYFLLNALFSLIPKISPIGPFTSVTPLCFVLTIAAIKDAVEDYQRHKADKIANSAPYMVLHNGHEVETRSEDIIPGDIVKINKGDQFPADLIVLSTSADEGVCYTETANLDGETNLKRRVTPPLTSHIKDVETLLHLDGDLYCELPSEFLYKFDGKIVLGEDSCPLTQNNLLLRGARLRNTKWVYGIVVYAGADTKMYKNLKISNPKFSHLEKKLNRKVLSMFFFNLTVLFVCSILSGYFHSAKAKAMHYLGDIIYESPASVAGVHILTYFILFTYMIPISLFVTLELVRVAQAKLMDWDNEMKGTDDNGKPVPMQARNSSMNEELGAIAHVFSDKTGTLTRNIMVLYSWCIAGKTYKHYANPNCLMEGQAKSPEDKKTILDFLRVLVLCNTVVPELNDDGTLSYEAQSPDEGALVEAAIKGGVVLKRRVGTRVEIEVHGELETYEMLATLEFTSDRKRMSVLVRGADGRIMLYSKGADNMIFERARRGDKLMKSVNKHVVQSSTRGLRTLVVARREIDPQTYMIWKKKFEDAEREMLDREIAVAHVCEEIEVEMEIIGSTAVEDKLQDKVPETIQYLLDAGLHVWLLTGDKQETAENIGMSSSLVSSDTHLLRLNAEDSVGCAKLIDLHLNTIEMKSSQSFALVIDGHTLLYALTDHPRLFLRLCELCQSVICCRVTPLQKALVVKLVKHELGRISLAIGDGANDVSMIQEANVGVGVMGREGTQAVRASDYAISEFRFLARLIAVHGRYSHVRLAHLIQYSFYKNLAYIMPQFFYGFYSGFTGQVLYDEIIMSSFNIVWSAAPPLFIGWFEKDVSEADIQLYPSLFQSLKTDNIFNSRSFASWIVSAVYHAAVVFFFSTVGVLHFGQVYGNGQVADQWVQSVFASTCSVFVTLLKVALTLRHWNFLSFLSVFLSMAGYLAFIMAYTGIPMGTFNLRMLNVGAMVYSSPVFYLLVLLVVVTALTPDIVLKWYFQRFHPTDWQVLRERRKKNLGVIPGFEPVTRSFLTQQSSTGLNAFAATGDGAGAGASAGAGAGAGESDATSARKKEKDKDKKKDKDKAKAKDKERRASATVAAEELVSHPTNSGTAGAALQPDIPIPIIPLKGESPIAIPEPAK